MWHYYNQGALPRNTGSSSAGANNNNTNKKQTAISINQVTTTYQEPPNDFRLINVYPTIDELVGNNTTFFRENVIQGPYRDVNHYLDVQFRLLREDFIAPLRKGIQLYLSNRKNGQSERLDDITVFKKVNFLNFEIVNEDRCFRIKFDFTQQQKSFNYEDSKRLMIGSLLCFTHDNFQSMIFGKVVKREAVDLQKGELIVGFSQKVYFTYNTDYVMIEPNAFFEPYYHVLTQLKRMRCDTFPLENYIIKVNANIKQVLYCQFFNIKYSYDQYVKITNLAASLNESQRLAFNAALAQELTIIQGPPGTGKTHLALKIVNALICSSSVWYNSSPILIICFTNHALDQFLEGISKFTEKIIRVGGQSKSKKLDKYNLRNIKQTGHNKNKSFMIKQLELKQIYNKLAKLMKELNDINDFRSIIVVMGEHFKINVLNGNYIYNWLLGWDITQVQSSSIFTFDIDMNREEMQTLKCKIFDKKRKIDEFRMSNKIIDKLLIEYNELKKQLALRQTYDTIFSAKLMEIRMNNNLGTFQFLESFKNTEYISLNDRWKFYFYYLNQYRNHILDKMDDLYNLYQREYAIFANMRSAKDAEKLKSAFVVGMTTTCAARMKSTLEHLKSPIVIVEEAAEVLEAHITSVLTEHCKQLILIGDHQQLKPTTADYSIEKKFNLGISLFERMVKNNIPCFTLNMQHRMKPEIAALIAPAIYPNLKNHESVYKRSSIRGVESSLFFIDHKYRENVTTETCKSNVHEVRFLINLAQYFIIVQGYQPANITILVTYSGQRDKMQNEKDKYASLKDVRVSVLDNYQGEQSDIILLSLVRNNAEGKMGFLTIENRVCVALSRARDGLFIMGNMAQLSKASHIWRQIHATLKKGNHIGPRLKLRCDNHPEKVTFAEKATDFSNVLKGCREPCNVRLVCGHNCCLLCNNYSNNEHNCGDEVCSLLLCENKWHVYRGTSYKEYGKYTYPQQNSPVKIKPYYSPYTYIFNNICNIL